jgi:hypothetical protein
MIFVRCSLLNALVVFVIPCSMLFFVQCCNCYSLLEIVLDAPCLTFLVCHSFLNAPCLMLLLLLLLFARCYLRGAPCLTLLVDVIIANTNPC